MSVGASVQAAAERLARGELVAFPTETVYGLGADASSAAAVARIFAAKGRPADHPLIVHLAEPAHMAQWATRLPDIAWALAEACWPGPLTLIVPRAAHVLDDVTGGQATVGLRVPSHPVARELLATFATLGNGPRGVAAPSANKFGHVSPTTAAHVREEFGDAMVVLDGGACEVGIESTIIDCTAVDQAGKGRLRVLRPGLITADALRAKLDERFHSILPEEQAPERVSMVIPEDLSLPRVSGSLDAHYAPRTPARLVSQAEFARLQSNPPQDGALLPCNPRDAVAYAHGLYAQLRALDALGAREIVIEAPPQGVAWDGVNDRLKRATFRSAS